MTASQHSSVAVQQLNNIGQMLSSFRDSKRGADHTNSATQASAEDAVNGHQQDLSSVLAQSDADSAESTALRNEIRELSTEMAAAQQTAARLQEQCDGLKAQLVVSLQDAQQVDALKQELAEQHARLEAAEHDQTRNSQLTKEVSRLQQEVQTFKQQASSIGTLEQQCQELQADLAKAKYSTEQSQNQLAEAQAELQQKQQTTAEVDTATQHPTTSNGPGEEQHHTDDTADELQALRRQLIQLQSALADAQQQRQQQQQSSQVQLADAHAELEPSVQASTDDQASLQDELHKAQEQVAQLQEELAAQQTAGQAGISNAPSLTALPSMALSQSELGEAADDAIQVHS